MCLSWCGVVHQCSCWLGFNLAPEAEVIGSNPIGCAINVKTAISAVFAFIVPEGGEPLGSTKSSGTIWNSSAGPLGRGQDSPSNPIGCATNKITTVGWFFCLCTPIILLVANLCWLEPLSTMQTLKGEVHNVPERLHVNDAILQR